MCSPSDVPRRTSLIKDYAGLVRQCVVRTSSTHPVVAFRRAALALALPATLLSSAALPQTPPVTVEAAPVTASVGRAITTSTSLQLGAPRVTAPTVGTVTTSALNLRTGPGTGYAVITVLGYGTQGTVLGQANGWYNVQTNVGTGWVSGTYFSVGATAPTAPAPAPASGTGYVTTSALNLRTGPGTGYGVITVLGYGTQGTIVGQANGWYNIQTTVGTGWVISTYFSVGSAPAPAAPAPVPAPVSGVVGARATMVPNWQFLSGWGTPRDNGPHQGEDLAAPTGSPIYAPAQLTILSNGWDSLGGWTVLGRDAKGRDWYFAHMNSRSAASGTVVKGQVIGYVGATGYVTGPHLHYQVSYPGGPWGNPVVVLQSYPDVP